MSPLCSLAVDGHHAIDVFAPERSDEVTGRTILGQEIETSKGLLVVSIG